MSSYGYLEKSVANLLSYMPGIKYRIKWMYQILNYVFYKKKYNHKTSYPIKAVCNSGCESFFGYYDKSPENAGGNYLIYHRSRRPTSRKPSENHPVEIVLKDVINNKETIIGSSSAYNWQQGTKLQWLTSDRFIYNFYDDDSGSYRSRIIDANTQKEISIIKHPVYDCYKDIYALSLNFSRLIQLRPDYGYRNLKEKIDFTENSKDGIFYIDLSRNSSKLLLSLQDIIELSPLKSIENARHKINHIMISPDGERFMFIHRWFVTGKKRYDRLIVANKNGDDLKLLIEGMVSHCYWANNKTITGFFHHRSNGAAYYIIDVDTSSISFLSDKLAGFGDGHPAILNGKMVFDSYPDRSRMKHLFLYDFNSDQLDEIGEFLEPLNYYGETRCDLHPKWNTGGDKLFIDSVHEGKRKLYELSVKTL
jgi:hypothetical protein